ncbi:MAG: TonB-dependent receptor plug domain-containing protein, partial [Steroidobacteraceae bacterium]
MGGSIVVLPLVHAQETSEPDRATDVAALGEILVTARKREELLLEVPLAVTAMTGSEIEARGVTSLLEAQYAVPGLTLTEFGPGQTRQQLRGVGSPGGASGTATVGYYLD